MSEVLYLPMVNAPERVVHHALLYRDGIATLAPDVPLAYLDERMRCALEAGLYRPLPAGCLWRNGQVQDAAMGQHDTVHLDQFRNLTNWWSEINGLVDWGIRGHATGPFERATVRVGLAKINQTATYNPAIWNYPETDSCPDDVADFDFQVMLATADILSELENESGTAPMFMPCFGPELVDVDRWIGSQGRNDVLLKVDVGRILPDPSPGIDTAALIRFRQKYDDERRRLIVAVERLVEQLAQTYSEPGHIERAVRRELSSALADMRSAGRAVLRGWTRRLFAVAVATSSTATALVASGTSPVLTVVGSVGAGIAVNKASEPIPDGLHDPRSGTYRYLHRISAAQA